MLLRPRFKSKYHLEILPGEGIFLLSESESHVLEGEILERIVPLIDGTNTWWEILAAVRPYVSERDVWQGFDVLLANGHLVEQDDGMPPSFQAFWDELDRSPQQARTLIADANLHLRTLGDVDVRPFVQAFGGFGFPLDEGRPASLVVAIVDDYRQPALAEINRACLQRGVAWLLVKPVGLKPLLGPLFVPGRTACWSCLRSRLVHNREVETFVERRTGRSGPLPVSRARVPLVEQQVAAMAAMQTVRTLALGHNPDLESRVLALDARFVLPALHSVQRRPQCPACGDPAAAVATARPVVLHSETRVDASENGSRVEAPEATFQRYAHHVSEITGIVKGIVPSPVNQAGPLRTYVAGHNFALKNDHLFFLKDGLRSHSSGKGRTDAQARTSALCEALERFSGLFRGEEPLIRSSFRELGEQAVDPRSILLFSDRQYEERERWLALGSRFQVVPQRFDESAEVHWSPVWSWSEERVKYLPASQLYYGFQEPDGSLYAWADSNGNAAGGTVQDAILQGFLELVERDAVALWWYNRVQRPEVDLDALDDPYFDDLRGYYADAGRELWVLDLTSDLGIPVCAAVNRRVGHATEDVILGFGAHPDPRVAVNRAVTEMNQFMPAVLYADDAGRTRYLFDDKDAVTWWTTATVDNQPYLRPSPETTRIEGAPEASRDLKLDIERLFAVVEAKGHEVLIMDQTRPDVGLPVVKVIVPGLRHFWARFAPGRLYDVPVAMGWRDVPAAEDELNPIAMFL